MKFLKKIFGGGPSDPVKPPNEWPATDGREPAVRDHLIKSHRFFDERVAQAQRAVDQIPELKREMLARPEPPTDLADFNDGVCDWHHNLIAAKYSRGDAVGELLPLCHVSAATAGGVLARGEDANSGRLSWKTLSRAVSFAVLSDAPQASFTAVSEMLRASNFRGVIVDYLVASRVPDHPVAETPYLPGYPSMPALAEVIQAGEEADCLRLSAAYLTKHFYTARNLEGEYDRHQRNGGASYYGYWAWQLAAILRVKGVDVSSLQGQPYFPYDFVTYQL